jgi:hypothetical protein
MLQSQQTPNFNRWPTQFVASLTSTAARAATCPLGQPAQQLLPECMLTALLPAHLASAAQWVPN